MRRHSHRTRWAIGALISTGILVNFFDRTALSVASPQLADEYGLTLSSLGVLLSAFSWSYCAMQLPSGLILDRFGVKWPNRIGTALWTLASSTAALAIGPTMVLVSRVLLGIGEGPAMCAAAKATSQWFPKQERGMATALFDGATKLSSLIAIPVLAAITSACGWRAAFWATAITSALYAVAWWRYYQDPSRHHRLSRTERRYILEGGARESDRVLRISKEQLLLVLRNRQVWAITLGFGCYGYAINLLLTWAPTYLAHQLHVPLLQTGLYAAFPWAVATVTDVAIGGWLVDRLVRSGRDSSKIRKTFLALGFMLGLAVGLAAHTSNPTIATLWITISIAGLSIAAPIAWSLPSLLAPAGTVGLVSGLMNTANTFLSLIGVLVTGFVAELTGSFTGPFLLAAGVLVVGLVLYLPVLGKIEPAPVSPHERDKAMS